MTEPDVVVLGGGHGLAATIRATRRYAKRVTAVVATADNGGSTGRLRRGMRIPAPGDLRRCLVAMAEAEQGDGRPERARSDRTLLSEALEYRFEGTDVEGHALGNLLLAGLNATTGDFATATDEVARLLGLDPARAQVRPATVEPVELYATTEDGALISGQVEVSHHERLARVRLEPPGAAAPAGIADTITGADQLILGPGSLYTSVLAAAIVEDVLDALSRAKAPLVYVCNLRTEGDETKGYDVTGHVEALRAHGVRPDVVLVDSACQMEMGALAEGAVEPVEIVTADVAHRNGLVHDPGKLAPILAGLAR